MSSRTLPPELVGIDVGSGRRTRLGRVETIDAAGSATLRMGRTPAGTYWLVDRGAFVAVGPAAGTVRVLVYNGPGLTDDNIEDFADIAVGAVQVTVRAIGEWNPPIWIPPGGELTVVFEGCVAATQAQVRAVARQLPNV